MWEYSILQCIASLGGKAYLKEIYAEIGKFVPLTKEHWKEQYRNPAYQNQVRAHIAHLKNQKGQLIGISRGYYSLTEKGQERLKQS